MSTVVHVNNISHQTSEQSVRDFFSFCGKITNISVKPTSDAADAPKAATVTFEKETAAKTALLLDNTQLGASQVSVSSGASLGELSGAPSSGGGDASGHQDSDDIPQEEKPRSRIVAEYLAHGYTLSDRALEQAIALDNKHGISNRFTNTLKTYDEKYKVTDRAKAVDQSYGVTARGQQAWAGLHSYFQKAIDTPTGQKLVDFYTNGNKQVMDIHTEARRLADLKGGKEAGSGSGSGSGASAGEGATGGASKEEQTRHNEETKKQVPGSDKTVCQCAGNDGVCACAPGKCACSGCGKSGISGEHTATGPADVVSATAGVQPLPDKSAV